MNAQLVVRPVWTGCPVFDGDKSTDYGGRRIETIISQPQCPLITHALTPDPFDTSDPFEQSRGTPSIEAAVAKSDKIHIREAAMV